MTKITKKIIDNPNLLPNQIRLPDRDWGEYPLTDRVIKNPIKTKVKRIQMLNKIKADARDNGVVIKCMSDELLLYLKYTIDRAVETCFYNSNVKGGIQYENPNAGLYKDEKIRRKEELEMDKDIAKTRIRIKAEQIYNLIRGNEKFVGFIPSTLAAAISYLVFRDAFERRWIYFWVTLEDIQDILMISPPTIAEMIKQIKSKVDLTGIVHELLLYQHE